MLSGGSSEGTSYNEASQGLEKKQNLEAMLAILDLILGWARVRHDAWEEL